MYGNLMMMRWVLLNLAIVMLGGFAWRQGLLAEGWAGDTTWVTTAILAVLAVGFVGVTARIAECSMMLDSMKDGDGLGRVAEYRLASKEEWATLALRTKLDSRVRPFEWLAYCLVMLGFFGTVWGMKMALVDIGGMSLQDAHSAGAILKALVAGFSVALWTTISGVVCFFVLSFNIRILEGGYDRLYTKLLEEPYALSIDINEEILRQLDDWDAASLNPSEGRI